MGAHGSAWCSAAALGSRGTQARGKLSLNALLSLRNESQEALNNLGGVMDVDDSTPEEVSSPMVKMKFLSDCVVLKVRTLDVNEGHPLGVALGHDECQLVIGCHERRIHGVLRTNV